MLVCKHCGIGVHRVGNYYYHNVTPRENVNTIHDMDYVVTEKVPGIDMVQVSTIAREVEES